MTLPAPHLDPIRRARDGDLAARRALLDRYGKVVWSLCRRLSDEPEDDYQAVWEKAFRALERFDPAGPAAFSTWIATVTHRHLVDRHRRRRVRGEIVALDGLVAADDPEGQVVRLDRSRRLEHAIARLPQDQRAVVVLHHLEGVPLEEIAAAEGVAVGTVKSRLHRARAKLADWLGGAR